MLLRGVGIHVIQQSKPTEIYGENSIAFLKFFLKKKEGKNGRFRMKKLLNHDEQRKKIYIINLSP